MIWVYFFVDGELQYPDSTAPWTFDWNTTALADSTEHALYAQASDAAGNEAASAIVEVLVRSGSVEDDHTPPAAVTDLTTGCPTGSSVVLSWTAPGNDADVGTAAQYDIRYATATIDESNWASATQLSSEPPPKPAGEPETFVVTGLSPNTSYFFALKTADSVPNWSDVSNAANRATLSMTGTGWLPLDTGLQFVRALGTYNGQLVANAYAGAAGGYYAAGWDGCSWSQAAPAMNRQIRALTAYDGRLIAGGEFTDIGGDPIRYIAAWNGTSWSSLGSGPDEYVYALIIFNGQLIAGGNFYGAGGVPAPHIAAWDGTSWSALGSGVENEVRALTIYNGQLVAGGTFGISIWNGSSWQELMSGPGDWINALTTYSGQLIAGGSHQASDRISAWNGTSWSILRTTDDTIEALAVYNGKLIAGGLMGGGVISWDGSSWSTLGAGVSGSVWALSVYEGRLIAGGSFSTAGGISARGIAAWAE